MRTITSKHIENFKNYLINEEKSEATVSKYLHDVSVFAEWLGEHDQEKVLCSNIKHTCVKNTRLPT